MKQETFTADEVRNAECNLEPIKCKHCESLEVTFYQYVDGGQAHCAECGEWQQMKLTIRGITKVENDQLLKVHLATINSEHPEAIGRVILECLLIAQKQPKLYDLIEVQKGEK